MNEDRFNMDIRKFLKVVGVTSQREIETAVREALAKGRLTEGALLKPRVTLSKTPPPLTLPLRGSLPLPARGERVGVRGIRCSASFARPPRHLCDLSVEASIRLFRGGHHDF